jgi:hypothetical protein
MMTRRKGTRADLRRRWPHQVALSADKVRSIESIVHRFANARSARRTFFTRRDDRDFVVFCFARREDADAFAARFGGERLAPSPPFPPLAGESVGWSNRHGRQAARCAGWSPSIPAGLRRARHESFRSNHNQHRGVERQSDKDGSKKRPLPILGWICEPGEEPHLSA